MATQIGEIIEATAASQEQLDPSHIMQVGMGFFASKTVLSAVELELFTVLGAGALSGQELGGRLGLGTWQSITVVDLNVDNPDREIRLSFVS